MLLSKPVAAAGAAAARRVGGGLAAMGASGGGGMLGRLLLLLLPTTATAGSTARRGLVTLHGGGSSSSVGDGPSPRGWQQRAPSGPPAAAMHQRRGVFTYPAPRKLSDIMKVPLVKKLDPLQIQEMWKEYHRERKDALAHSIPAIQFRLLKDRARVSRVFLYPVFRDQGYMTLISQFQDTCFLFTFLEDYRKNPQAATPWMCLTLYDEFLGDKGVGLLRGDVSHHITREEGEMLLASLVEHYTHADKYKTLYQFNHEPKKFSFEAYVRKAPRPPPKADAGSGSGSGSGSSPIILK